MRKTETASFPVWDESKKAKVPKEFLFTQFSPKEGFKVSIRVAKIISGPIGSIFSNLKKVANAESDSFMDNYDFDERELGKAFESLTDKLEEEEMIDTVGLLLGSVMANGQPMHWESIELQGDPMLALKLAFKSAQVNFADFFALTSGVGDSLKRLGEKVMSQAQK